LLFSYYFNVVIIGSIQLKVSPEGVGS
jgi:hypothetical protein